MGMFHPWVRVFLFSQILSKCRMVKLGKIWANNTCTNLVFVQSWIMLEGVALLQTDMFCKAQICLVFWMCMKWMWQNGRGATSGGAKCYGCWRGLLACRSLNILINILIAIAPFAFHGQVYSTWIILYVLSTELKKKCPCWLSYFKLLLIKHDQDKWWEEFILFIYFWRWCNPTLTGHH